MNKIYFEVEDNAVVKHTPMPEMGENTYKTEVVITKEIFQECYKKWVEQQEPKTGHWKEINYKDFKSLCSNCGTWSPIMGNYCPNCGAKMGGGKQ